ncbi:hypothetical protein [Spiroplasma floricola]|uniref:DUF2326 domain-containing protein n=1 Tax=Spiroplasma floricola 23-6 TaxID=1336749 RepID=A0A2K8SE35_9MOLU|nr:hypothetical protein [Spiroplasma floricola]AUB31727.1 hypothetical protein SFLOR_v1c06790 [Spiroplasma floricola 23-6]
MYYIKNINSNIDEGFNFNFSENLTIISSGFRNSQKESANDAGKSSFYTIIKLLLGKKTSGIDNIKNIILDLFESKKTKIRKLEEVFFEMEICSNRNDEKHFAKFYIFTNKYFLNNKLLFSKDYLKEINIFFGEEYQTQMNLFFINKIPLENKMDLFKKYSKESVKTTSETIRSIFDFNTQFYDLSLEVRLKEIDILIKDINKSDIFKEISNLNKELNKKQEKLFMFSKNSLYIETNILEEEYRYLKNCLKVNANTLNFDLKLFNKFLKNYSKNFLKEESIKKIEDVKEFYSIMQKSYSENIYKKEDIEEILNKTKIKINENYKILEELGLSIAISDIESIKSKISNLNQVIQKIKDLEEEKKDIKQKRSKSNSFSMNMKMKNFKEKVLKEWELIFKDLIQRNLIVEFFNIKNDLKCKISMKGLETGAEITQGEGREQITTIYLKSQILELFDLKGPMVIDSSIFDNADFEFKKLLFNYLKNKKIQTIIFYRNIETDFEIFGNGNRILSTDYPLFGNRQ